MRKLKLEMTRPRKEYFTPASLLLSYARKHEDVGFKLGRNEKLALRIGESYFLFTEWQVEPVDKKTSSITLLLDEISREEAHAL